MWQILPIMPSSALWQIDSAPEGACAEVPDASDWWAFFALHSLTFLKEGRSDTCQRKDSEESCWVRDASSVLYLHSQVCVPHLPQHRGSFWMDFLSPQLAQSCFFLTSFSFFLYFYLFVAPPFHSDIEFTGGRHSEKLQKQIESPWLFLSKNFLFLIGGKLLSSIVLCCTIM